MSDQELHTFEHYCETLYNSASANERAEAEAALMQLSTSPDCIPRCQFVLSKSQLPYAQLVATNALKKLFSSCWNHLTEQQKSDGRNYVLNFLASIGPTCQPFVNVSLAQLLASITKLGWVDFDDPQQVMQEVSRFLHATPAHLIIGLQILQALVTEVNSASNSRSLALHRKVAGAFRDCCLYQIFKLSLETLQRLQARAIPATETQQAKIRETSLGLALACLSYDFIGTTLDEASEELGTIQVPSTWRLSIEDPSTVSLFFDLYAFQSTSPCARMVLEVLVSLCALRRSLFSSDEERQAFLLRMVSGTLSILQLQCGLSDHDNYHELCRLLARLKANFQLSELVTCAPYADWIALVATFTVDSFKHWEWAANSVYYLLAFWSRLVASMPYLKGETPSHLESYVPRVITAFITSRMELVSSLIRHGGESGRGDGSHQVDNPLDDDEQLMEQLDALPALCRFELQQVSSYVISLFEPAARNYAQALAQPAQERTGSEGVRMRLAQSEGELAWLIYIIGQILGSHLTPNSNAETQQLVDGELTALVLQLVPLLDDSELAQERAGVKSNQHLQCAFLFFLQQFRKVYVGDQATASSKVYGMLQARLQLSDHLAVLVLFVNKIVANLQMRGLSHRVNEKSLALFSDLASGYCSGKLLLKLDAVQYMLRRHAADDFPFLRVPVNVRLRTLFYCTLCKLLFLDDSHIKFKTFMEPFTSLLRSLKGIDDASFASPHVRLAIVGVLRDLRGVVTACSNRRTYAFLFDWLHPEFTPLLLRAAHTYFDKPDVTTPLLKLYAELVYNKAQRLAFDSSSPNGILLFRDASAVVCAYGRRICKAQPLLGCDRYDQLYKGISICMLILTRALSGNYVNFGVFALYGDRALADCLEVTIDMCLSVSLEQILTYPKVSRAYFSLMELLMRSHTSMLVELDGSILRHLCASLNEGLKSHEVATSSQCAAALEHLAAYRFREMLDAADDEEMVHESTVCNGIRDCVANASMNRSLSELQKEHHLFAAQLRTLLHMIVFEDCTNQWSLSRPLLALILVAEEAFEEWKEQALATMSAHPQRQRALAIAFEKLMQDVPRGKQANLDVKTRDRFTQNLSQFRHEVRTLV